MFLVFLLTVDTQQFLKSIEFMIQKVTNCFKNSNKFKQEFNGKNRLFLDHSKLINLYRNTLTSLILQCLPRYIMIITFYLESFVFFKINIILSNVCCIVFFFHKPSQMKFFKSNFHVLKYGLVSIVGMAHTLKLLLSRN